MNPELLKKSVHDLRIMAQAFGVTDIFEKDQKRLIQDIELKQQSNIPAPIALPPRPAYDGRLMTATPSQTSSPIELTELLTPHIMLGLKLSFQDEHWFMHFGKREDSGTLRMPLRTVMDCADKLMQ